MQLQHYERWRKRLLDDPYKMLFGASNDMLSGKGLKDWEWIHKSFPKWMLQEMNVDEQPQEAKKAAQERCPKKAEISDDEPSMPNERFRQIDGSWGSKPDPKWRQALYKMKGIGGGGPWSSSTSRADGAESSHRSPRGWPLPPSRLHQTDSARVVRPDPRLFDDDVSGVESPSDPRRLREDVNVKAFGKATCEVPAKDPAGATLAESWMNNGFSIGEASVPDTVDAARKEATARESSFIDEFLNTKYKSQEPSSVKSDGKDWRQTVLQRRLAPETTGRPGAQFSSISKPRVEATARTTASPPTDVAEAAPETQSIKPNNKNIEWLLQQETSSLTGATKQPKSRGSTFEKLSQLPEDDLDFISAADVRASMGARRSRLPTDEQKRAKRENLEKAFVNTSESPNIHPMSEAKVLNDHYVRRMERVLTQPSYTLAHFLKENEEKAAQLPRTPETKSDTAHSTDQTSATEARLAEGSTTEASAEPVSMKKWLETIGAKFANAFWQDPTEHADWTKSKVFFDKAAYYVKKGQVATRQVTEDLEKDIPASSALIKRLRNDEKALDLAIHRLRQRSPSTTPHAMAPRKVHAMVNVKQKFTQTDEELERAYKALHDIKADAAANATGSFKRRLTAALKVLDKNSQLLRTLIWSLQNRLEDPNIDRKILANYKLVADNLLSLRDTQMTLMRFVDRAMLVYGVVPDTSNSDNSAIEKSGQLGFDACEEPFVRARLAADAHLINEIKAHNSTAQEITNAESTQATKPMSSKVHDPLSPSAHSLFRPFGPAFYKLGTPTDPAAEEAAEGEKRKLGDTKAVDGVEMIDGGELTPVTVDKPQAREQSEMQGEKEAKKFEMLKEDPAAIDFVTPNETAAAGFNTDRRSEVLSHGTPGSRLATEAAATSRAPSDVMNSIPTSAEATSKQSATTSSATPTAIDLPTHYTILVRDPQTDALSTTTSSTGPPRDTSPALPLHRALAALDSPAKFIPYITSGLEVVSANKDILVLRDALDPTASTKGFEIVKSSSSTTESHSDRVNPIDGTTRLSPTGYVGPEESAEQLEREFKERRDVAGKIMDDWQPRNTQAGREQAKASRRRTRAGVIKTVVWVAGGCYVVGVLGEVLTGT